MTIDRVETFLEHFGVKGMKWGQRKVETAGSEDHEQTKVVKAKNKAGGVKALSNKELEAAIRRINLEKQWSTLNPSKLDTAKRVVQDLLGIGNTVNQVMGFVNSPSGKLMREGFKK